MPPNTSAAFCCKPQKASASPPRNLYPPMRSLLSGGGQVTCSGVSEHCYLESALLCVDHGGSRRDTRLQVEHHHADVHAGLACCMQGPRSQSPQQHFNDLPCEAGGPSGAPGHNRRSSLADLCIRSSTCSPALNTQQ